MFFLPIGFLKTFYRVPVVNLVLIGLCVVTMFLQAIELGTDDSGEPVLLQRYLLLVSRTAADLSEEGQRLGFSEAEVELEEERLQAYHDKHSWVRQPWALLTHAFCHADILHLVGNMLFLFVFGCAVNGEFGQLKYLALFLTGALISGVGSLALGEADGLGLLGASGAISAITGIVAALYPQNEIRAVWMFMYRFGMVEVMAVWVILAWFALDVLGSVYGAGSGVAYVAHTAGTLTGFAFGLVCLKSGWVDSDGYDVLSWTGAGKPRRSRQRPEEHLGRGRPAPLQYVPPPVADLPPLKLWDDADEDANGTVQAEEPVADPSDRGMPVHQRLASYFGVRRGFRNVPEADYPQVATWYRRYRDVHAGVPLEAPVLHGCAKVCAAAGETDLALDAYRRLESVTAADRWPPLALEAAVCAYKGGAQAAARQYLQDAQAGPLTDRHEQVARKLALRLGRR